MKKKSTIIILIFFTLLIAAAYAAIIFKAPFSDNTDAIYYMGKTLSIIDSGGLNLFGEFDAYNFTPLLFFLIASIMLVTGATVQVASVVLIFLQLICLIFIFYILGKELFNNNWIGLIISILGISVADQLIFASHSLAPFMLLRAQKFSLILFLFCTWLAFKYFNKNNNRLLLLIIPISGCMILFHHQSGIVYWLIFYLFFITCLFVLKKEQWKKILFLIIGLAPFILIAIINYFFNGIIIDRFIDPNSVESLSVRHLDLYFVFGLLIILYAIIGLYLLIFRIKKLKIQKIFIYVYLLICLLGMMQIFFGGNFFPERFAVELSYPLVLLNGVLFYFLINYHFKKIAIIGGVIITFTGIIALGAGLINVKFDLPWNYFKATNWAYINLEKDHKFLSDVNTSIQFSQLSKIEPAVPITRTRNLKKHNSDEAFQNTIKQNDPEKLISYMKENDIEYFIYDTKMSNRSTPGNYDLVTKNKNLMELKSFEIIEGKIIKIYKLR